MGACRALLAQERRLAEKKKTKAQRQVSVQEVRIIHFSNRARNEASGQQCRGHRENKRSRARVWRKSYKVYKESVFLYNNKKPKATRAVVYTKHGDIASLANRFLTRRGDKTERGAWDGVKAGERAACKKEGEVGRGSSPSINLQAGA